MACAACVSTRARAAAASLALAWLLLLLPLSAAAESIRLSLLVSINDEPGTFTAEGGADATGNTPLDLVVAPGDELEVIVLMSLGVPIREYQTTITADDPASLDYVSGSATDVSTLGFWSFADPDATLQDGDPGNGVAGTDPLGCPALTCVAPSTNTLYRLRYLVADPFAADALRDLTISLDSVAFERPQDSLDPAFDTASIRLVPEPGTAGLLGLGIAALAARRGRS